MNTKEYKGTICACAFCGDYFGSSNGTCALHCKFHRTIQEREKAAVEQAAIERYWNEKVAAA